MELFDGPFVRLDCSDQLLQHRAFRRLQIIVMFADAFNFSLEWLNIQQFLERRVTYWILAVRLLMRLILVVGELVAVRDRVSFFAIFRCAKNRWKHDELLLRLFFTESEGRAALHGAQHR